MYRAIEEGRSRKSSYVTISVAAVACCLVGAAFFMGSAGEPQLSLTAARGIAGVGCRNVRAQAQADRRAVLGGLFGAAATFGVSKSALADIRNPDFIDDRAAKKKGFDIIYEARDLSLDQDVRDGFTQTRTSMQDTKKRVADAEKKLTEAGAFVDKKYWTEGRNVLRRLVGTLRFDLAALADTKSGAAKKEAIKANKEFFQNLESMDLAMYKKNPEAGKKAYTKTMAAYKNAISLY